MDAQYYATQNLKLSLSAGYNNAEFQDDLTRPKGTRLPMTPKVNGNLALEYNFELAGYSGFIRSDYNYVGSYYTDLDEAFSESGDYGQWNLRAGMEFDQTSVEIYGNNLTNEDSLVGTSAHVTSWRLPPRLIGMDVSYNF